MSRPSLHFYFDWFGLRHYQLRQLDFQNTIFEVSRDFRGIGIFTREALQNISATTIENLTRFKGGQTVEKL